MSDPGRLSSLGSTAELFPAGTHMRYIYNDERERLEPISKFVESGLQAHCQYDARRFDGATLFDVLNVHPMMIIRGQVVRNPYYVEPEHFLERHLSCRLA